MKQTLILVFFFFQVIILNAQQIEEVKKDYASTELPVEPWKASYPKQLPPREVLNHIDTIRSGLYRSSVGRNFGYFTDEYYQGFFTDTETVIPFEYYSLPRDYSNFMIVENQKAGVIDSLNNFIIPMIYTSLSPLNREIPLMENKYLKAWIGKKMGLLNFAGEVQIPIEYKSIEEITPNVFSIQNMDKKFGLADLRNNTFTECKYNDGIKFFNKKFCKVGVKTIKDNRVNRKFGCIDLTGKEIAKPIYRTIELSTDENYVIAYDGINSKIFNPKGEIVFQKDSVEIKNLVKGIYTFNISQKQFVIRNDFQETVELIDQAMKTLTPDFYLDIKVLRHRNKWLTSRILGVKNYLGEEILPVEFDEIIYSNDDLLFATKKDQPLFAGYNQEGEEVIPPIYSYVQTKKGFSVVKKPDELKFALVNQAGKEVTSFIYDELLLYSTKPGIRNFEIIAKRSDKTLGLSAAGKEIATKKHLDYYRHLSWFQKRNEANVTTSQFLKGNRYRYILEEDILIQYIFNEDSTGQKIIFTKDKKGNELTIEVPFFRTVSGTGYSKGKEILWLFFDHEKQQGKDSKSILKKLRKQGLLEDMEFYSIASKYPYKNTFSMEILSSKIDYQKGSLEEKQKLKTLLEIQSKMQKEMVYQPLFEEEAPKVWIDLETQICFMINLKSSKQRFSKVNFQDGEWYLGSINSQDPAMEKFDSFLLFKNMNYLNEERKIVSGTLKLDYRENGEYSYLVF